jgi:hypothetical protein
LLSNQVGDPRRVLRREGFRSTRRNPAERWIRPKRGFRKTASQSPGVRSERNAVKWIKPGIIRCEAGLMLDVLDDEARKTGWEIRLYPSTKRTATVGGHVAGGSGGVSREASVGSQGRRSPPLDMRHRL